MDYLPPRSAAGTKKLMEGHRKGRTKPSNLREQVDPKTMKMYPTPQAADHLANQSETLEAWEKRAKQKKEEKGINLQFALRHAVQKEEKQKRMYPTPRASGQENVETLIKRKGEKAAAQHNLTANVQMFPTPSANEQQYRLKGDTQASKCLEAMARRGEIMFPTPSASCQMDVVAPPETVKQNSSGWSVTRVGTGTKFGAKLNDVVNKVNQPIKPGGKLNPTFVEFLMGFPMNWTKVELTE
jgi:hypothetical protein